jgi:hypothetical protein
VRGREEKEGSFLSAIFTKQVGKALAYKIATRTVEKK